MNGQIALCADEVSLMHPEVLGLAEIDLESLEWLKTFSSGAALRDALCNGCEVAEVWVASAEDVEPANLIAALRKDGYVKEVCLVIDDATGSALSRATAAGVSTVCSLEQFMQRVSLEARRRSRMSEVAERGIAVSAPSSQAAVRQGNPRQIASPEGRGKHAPIEALGSGTLITVVGGSGGVGKSTVAACLAASAAVHGQKVLLMDADLQFGCLHRMLGAQGTATFDDAAADADVLKKLVSQASAGSPAVLGAPKRLEHSETLVSSVAPLACTATTLFDAVIVDTGSTWTEAHASLIEASACVLFVIDQRAGSVHACKHALELCNRMGLATSNFAFVLNRCSKEALFTPTDVSCALGGVRVFEVSEGGIEADELFGGGAAAFAVAQGTDLVQSIEALGRVALPQLFEKEEAQGFSESSGSSFFRSWGRGHRRRRSRKSHEIVVKTGAPSPEFRSVQQAWESL